MRDDGHIPSRVHDPIEAIDWNKLKSVFRRKWIWIALILISSNFAGYLFLRYTKPVFESTSDLKLDIKREAMSLGLNPYPDAYNMDNLSGEIEIINSRLFFNRVIDIIDIEVQYFTYGQILDDEKYKHSPFIVEWQITNEAFYDTPIDVTLIDENNFTLRYNLNGKSISGNYQFEALIETEHFIFKLEKTSYFNKALLDENFYFIINSHDLLVKYLEDNITVEPLNLNAQTIKVSFRDHNKYKAHDLVNAIDTLYLLYTYNQKNQANENKINYLNEQMEETEKILSEYEDYFEDFTIENKTVDLDEDVKKTLEYMNQLDSQRYELRARIKHIEEISERIITEKLQEINLKRNYLPLYILREVEAFDELRFEQEQLALSYRENTFAYEKKSNELNHLKESLEADLNQYKINLYESLTNTNNKISALDKKLLNLPSKGTEYNKSKRFYALYEEMYLSLMKSKNEFEIARAGTIPDFKILASATLPDEPISPKKFIVYGVGIVSGFILSFFFLGISYLLSNKITSIQEIEGLTNTPIAGILPFEYGVNEKTRLLVLQQPKSATSEAFRSIRTNIEFMIPNAKNRVISVSSTISGEGKTFVTLNLGGVIAMSGQKVVVLDLDLRKPKIHKNFDQDSVSKGISTILIDRHSISECILKSDHENLDYIPAGPIPPNPSELLLNGAFDQLITSLKENYQTIILDTPPIGMVTDAIMAMKKADLKLFVLRAEYSKISFVNTVNRLVEVNKFQNIGLILNGMKSGSNLGYGYGYGYGNGSHYYENVSESWVNQLKRKIGS